MSENGEKKPAKLVNFYKLKKVQKHMPELKDEQKKHTGIPLQQHILACGKTGSGKSLALLNYILESSKPAKGTFFKVILCYKTYEGLYKYLEDELKEKLQLCEGIDAVPDIKSFADASETNKKQYLVIWDDCVNDKDAKQLKKIQPFYTYGRKKGITNFFLTQSFFQTDIFIRKQTSWLLLCGISGNQDLKAILRNYAIGDIDLPTMLSMYQYAKQKDEDDDITFLKVCCYECPTNKKFSKNWLEYLSPADFRGRALENSREEKRGGAASVGPEDKDEDGDTKSETGEASDEEVVYVSLADILRK